MNFFRQPGAALMVALFGAILAGGGGPGGEGQDAAGLLAVAAEPGVHARVCGTASGALPLALLWFLLMAGRELRATVARSEAEAG